LPEATVNKLEAAVQRLLKFTSVVVLVDMSAGE
jgi:hypothetical protein